MNTAAPNRRVGYVVKRYPRYSETFIVQEILAHERAGLEIEIFSLYPPNDTHFQNLISQVKAPVTYLPGECVKGSDFWMAAEAAGGVLGNIWADLAFAMGEDARWVYQALLLARQVKLRRIGHLHAHFATSATSVARLAGRFSKVPYSFTAHAKDIYHESVDPADLDRKLRDAAAVVTVSDYNASFLRTTYGSATHGLRRIYNGLDLEQFSYEPPLDRPPLIISVGRLVEKKGFSDLIDACAVLERQGVEFHCEIIGSGPLESCLREQIRKLELSHRIRLTGPLPQCEVVRRIQSASVFVAPYVVAPDGNRDGLPTVLLESMALGTPCVSTDVTGVPEVVQDGVTGLIVPQHNVEAIAAAARRLLEDQESRVGLSEAARSLMEREFDIQKNTPLLREFFAASADRSILAMAEVQ